MGKLSLDKLNQNLINLVGGTKICLCLCFYSVRHISYGHMSYVWAFTMHKQKQSFSLSFCCWNGLLLYPQADVQGNNYTLINLLVHGEHTEPCLVACSPVILWFDLKLISTQNMVLTVSSTEICAL